MDYNCENGNLVIVPEQAEVVKTIFQKAFTEDYITGKRKDNHGERAKYYVEDTHPAIVSKDVFNRVQEEMKRRERVFRNDDGSIEASKSKQIVIKYIYRKISASVRADRGLGVGTHPWEERQARTMLIEKSIFADRILANIAGKDERLINEPYRRALRNSNISSSTWNYVGCINDGDSLTKLAIVKECLLNVKVSSRQEMVLCRYVGGLRKISQY